MLKTSTKRHGRGNYGSQDKNVSITVRPTVGAEPTNARTYLPIPVVGNLVREVLLGFQVLRGDRQRIDKVGALFNPQGCALKIRQEP